MDTIDFLLLAKILALMFLFGFGACLVLSVYVQWTKDAREEEEWEQGEEDSEPMEEESEEE